MRKNQKSFKDKLKATTTGQEYLSLITSRPTTSLRKAMRAQRRAQMIDAGLISADDSVLEAVNMQLDDKVRDENYDMYLHPTKGYRKRTKRKHILAGADKAMMWKIIQNNLTARAEGRFDDIIRSSEWKRVRKLKGLPV